MTGCREPALIRQKARFVGGLAQSECYTLDSWFEKKLFTELRGIEENAEPIFFIHANFKFNPRALRCFRFGLEVLEHIRFTRSLPDRIRYAPAVLYSFEPNWRLAAAAEHPLLLPGAGLAYARLRSTWRRWPIRPVGLVGGKPLGPSTRGECGIYSTPARR